MILKYGLIGLAGLWAGAACAANQPLYAPPPAWVTPHPIPQTVLASGAALQPQLQDNQALFGADGDEFYDETAYRILTAEGLSAAGNVILNWNPDTDTLVIHRLNIIRNGQVMDALAGGKTFTVLRREKGLELATLDGTLTATLQLEGLQVGDIVDLAISRRHKDPVFQGRSENFAQIERPGVIGRVYIRQIWPASKPMRWRVTEGLEKTALIQTANGSELIADLSNIEAAKPPRDAPSRFDDIGQMEVSQFSDWSEVSALMEPLYRKASTIGPNSPLRAEVDRIAAATHDPKARTLAALRLVQDQTRYVFLGMNNGGFIPAQADTTWARRYGDCKGKAALLLALLKALGVSAQPALVNTEAGDGLDQRLPLLEVFDHVIVKARIGARVYWLDGTRLGDHDLDLIPTPDFHWALPIQASGATLEKLTPADFTEPHFESEVRLDASAGLDTPAELQARHQYRGDSAIEKNVELSSLGAADADRFLRDYWRREIPWATPKTVGFHYDDAHEVLTLSIDGTGSMNWTRNERYRDFDIGDSSLGYDTSFKREPGPHQDAPFAVNYPMFKTWHVSITLPKAGMRFLLLSGQDVDQTLAGIIFRRKSQIQDGVVTMEATERSVAPEFPAKEAEADAVALRQLGSFDVAIRAEPKVTASESDRGDTPAPPTDARGFARRGEHELVSGDYAAGLADFEQASRLEPSAARYVYNEGIAEYQLGDAAKALADFDQALKLDPNDLFALLARGRVNLAAGHADLATRDFEALVNLSAATPDVLGPIIQAYESVKGYEEIVHFLNPLVAAAKDPQSRARLLNDRCWARGQWNHQLGAAMTDCDAALKIEPNAPNFLDSRGLIDLQMGRFAEAITDYDAALKLRPKNASSLYGRGIAQRRLGQATEGDMNIAAAKAIRSGIETEFAGYGLRP